MNKLLCPTCTGKAVMSERRVNGYSWCVNGHKFPGGNAVGSTAVGDDIGGRLRALRRSRGLRFKVVAYHTGVTADYISALERGIKLNPGVKLAVKLAAFFDVSVGFLVAGE